MMRLIRVYEHTLAGIESMLKFIEALPVNEFDTVNSYNDGYKAALESIKKDLLNYTGGDENGY